MKRNSWITLIFVLSPFLLLAQPESFKPLDNVEAFKQKARERAEKTNTIKSDFVQEKHLSFMEDMITSKGDFVFKKKNKVRWEYQDPFEYLIVIKDEQLIIKDKNKTDEHDMGSNKMFRQINEMIISSVQGTILDREDFDVEYYEGAGRYLVILAPQDKTMKDLMKEIQLYFSKTDHTVEKVKMVESNGDFTRIEFQNKQLNTPVADEVFQVDK